jgi:DNA-binding MarR family transcriptional regulator
MPPDRLAEIEAHPNFQNAVLLSARSFIELFRHRGFVGWILGDRARALLLPRLLYLEATHDPADPRSGIIASRVRAECVALQLCSPGRATAMLALMQTTGYLVPGPSAQDRRVKRLVPTEKLWSLQGARLAAQMAAVAQLLPAAARGLARLDDRRFRAALNIALNDWFSSGFRVLHQAPEMALFAERSGGVLMLYCLLVDSAERGCFPPTRPMPFAIADLSRRLRLSRTHILRLVRDAADAGLLVRRGDEIEFSVRLRAALMDFFASMFLLFDRSAAVALGDPA